VLSFRGRSVDAVAVAILGRKKEWVRYQGRANAALLLLARDMEAEFLEPPHEKLFAGVQGRARGCSFVLRIGDGKAGPALHLTVRHFHSQHTVSLTDEGCTIPDLDPAAVRAAIEDACHGFATSH
jgi:hypothetical protein